MPLVQEADSHPLFFSLRRPVKPVMKCVPAEMCAALSQRCLQSTQSRVILNLLVGFSCRIVDRQTLQKSKRSNVMPHDVSAGCLMLACITLNMMTACNNTDNENHTLHHDHHVAFKECQLNRFLHVLT